ncbi:MAG: winged helix DNA-binding domain-containing protein [Candidatus Bathyarchaeota archaeon]|nr:winged helix DNA-binding domain-containing protein [Candidatus Bathyarchaeota archaeon]
MVETYSKEVIRGFALRRLRLTPSTLGKSKNDVLSVVRAIGGLQYGGHLIELFNRFENFKPKWFDYWYENYTLIEGHVLRGALRIVNTDEYPYYFRATRSVARRRASYQKCPLSLTDNHLIAFSFMEEHGPFTPSKFKTLFGTMHPQLKDIARRLLYELCNYGKVARMGRKNQKPLYYTIRKLPYKLDMSQISEEEAKKWLYLKCLSIYGPFAVEDVAHWVGWNITEAKEILKALLNEKKVINVKLEDDQYSHFVRVEDLDLLNYLRDNLPEHSFIRILFNDDALLLGYYRKLKDYFGYHWKYPQLSEGITWRAAIIYGRQLAGEAIVDMYAKSSLFKIRRLILRKEFATSEISSKMEGEFRKHADFQNKILEMTAPELI